MFTQVKARTFVLVVLLAAIALLFPTAGYAEETNRNEVRAELASGGWTVIYGDLINEHDYLEFAAAVASAVATENPGPIYEFFNDQLQAQVVKIGKQAPDIPQEVVIELLIAAFDSEGQVQRRGNLEISADLATYNRWETVIYDEPRTYKCKQDLLGVGWTWSTCSTMERVEKTIPYPNNFQPYFRYRWIPETPVEAQETPYGLVCLVNNTGWDINYRYRWGDGEWYSKSVAAGRSRYHWWDYEPGSFSSPNFEIRFDADFGDATDYKQYDLTRYRASRTACDAGKVYEFERVNDRAIDLYDSGD